MTLSAIGVTSRLYFRETHPNIYTWTFSKYSWLNIWGIWDSGYYLDIAKRGYSLDQNFEFPIWISPNPHGTSQINYGFFPLYPILIRILNFAVGNYFISGILISNISFLLSALLLFKIAGEIKNEEYAKRTIKYFFLFPTSFVFSGVFSEAPALLLMLMVLYFAKKRRWVLAGISGALSLIAKLTAGVIMLPLTIEALLSKKKIKDYLWGILTVPVGLIGFFIYCFYKTGNPFFYFSVKHAGWEASLVNPLRFFYRFWSLSDHSSYLYRESQLIFLFIVFEIILLIFSYKKLPFSLWAYWFVLFIISLSGGLSVTLSIPRHALLFFPQYISLSYLTKKRSVDLFLSIFLISTQIVFMALWVNGLVII